MNGFYFGEVRTPYFPGFKFDFLNPGSTRHGIFDEVSEMEFDDMDTWPVRYLFTYLSAPSPGVFEFHFPFQFMVRRLNYFLVS